MHRIQTLSLRFEPNKRFHDDLVLRIDRRAWRCDSYYLLLDNRMLPDREDEDKVRLVLRRLLDQWSDAVRGLGEGDVCFLPFDFSDQSTGWLRCEFKASDLIVVAGWAEVEGWSFLPSDAGNYLHLLPGFKATDTLGALPRDAFLEAIAPDDGRSDATFTSAP